jgi:hypothetical protein
VTAHFSYILLQACHDKREFLLPKRFSCHQYGGEEHDTAEFFAQKIKYGTIFASLFLPFFKKCMISYVVIWSNGNELVNLLKWIFIRIMTLHIYQRIDELHSFSMKSTSYGRNHDEKLQPSPYTQPMKTNLLNQRKCSHLLAKRKQNRLSINLCKTKHKQELIDGQE